MPKSDFGFTCGEFAIVLSGNNIILLGSKNAPLKKSLLPDADMNDTAGEYRLQGSCQGKIICDLLVQVVWVSHESQSEPILGLKTENAEEVRQALRAYVGRRVELTFSPRESD